MRDGATRIDARAAARGSILVVVVVVNSRATGAIPITERYSLVDVPAEMADDIVRGMRGATSRGRADVIQRSES